MENYDYNNPPQKSPMILRLHGYEWNLEDDEVYLLNLPPGVTPEHVKASCDKVKAELDKESFDDLLNKMHTFLTKALTPLKVSWEYAGEHITYEMMA